MLQALAGSEIALNVELASPRVVSLLTSLVDAGADDPRRSPGPDSYAAVLDQLPASVYMTDAEGLVVYANQAASQLAGREVGIGRDRWCVAQRSFAGDGSSMAHEDHPMCVALRERRPVRGVEAILERPDGTRVPFLSFPTPLFDAQGNLIGGFNLLVDISERKLAEERLADARHHDALTGLANRLALGSHLANRIDRARREGTGFVLLRLDLDGFRALNDESGHAVGDAVLMEVARRLRAKSGDDFLARIGGDEFMLVSSSDLSEGGSAALGEHVRAAFATEFLIGDARYVVRASAGAARFPQDGEDEIRLVACANAALQLAKAEGPGAIRMFDPAEQAIEQERLCFRRNLRDAIDTGEIQVHYQPLFRADGTAAGFEALARWSDPVRGMVAPSAFIPAAEAAGLIASLDTHVLRSACREAAGWPRPLRVSVNISATEFQSGDLVSRVEDVLAETGLDPERLELEITESVMVTDADRAMATFAKLRALGVRIALDDFGTGYSSLSYLHRFPDPGRLRPHARLLARSASGGAGLSRHDRLKAATQIFT